MPGANDPLTPEERAKLKAILGDTPATEKFIAAVSEILIRASYVEAQAERLSKEDRLTAEAMKGIKTAARKLRGALAKLPHCDRPSLEGPRFTEGAQLEQGTPDFTVTRLLEDLALLENRASISTLFSKRPKGHPPGTLQMELFGDAFAALFPGKDERGFASNDRSFFFQAMAVVRSEDRGTSRDTLRKQIEAARAVLERGRTIRYKWGSM